MDAFAALADPVRRSLLLRLATAPARVVDLAADHDISRPAVSRHLRVLGQARLVSADQRGRERHYRLESAGLDAIGDYLGRLRPAPLVAAHRLDGLELEIHRTVRESASRPAAAPSPSPQEETA